MALDAGLDTVKFFPAEQLGGARDDQGAGRAVPSVRFIPTGGVTPATSPTTSPCRAVLAVGGTWMVAPAPASPRGAWDEVTELDRRGGRRRPTALRRP